jgi:DNA polymerase-3 subunit alpha
MLLQAHLVDWERANGIRRGYGRGSVNGSLIAYLLGITEMDSLKFNLNLPALRTPTSTPTTAAMIAPR